MLIGLKIELNTGLPCFAGRRIFEAIQFFCRAEKKSVSIRKTRIIRVPVFKLKMCPYK